LKMLSNVTTTAIVASVMIIVQAVEAAETTPAAIFPSLNKKNIEVDRLLTSGAAPANKPIYMAMSQGKSGSEPEPKSKSKPIFFDSFEYIVNRDINDSGENFRSHGWYYVKSINTTEKSKGKGYLYTTERIPGYAGTFPGKDSKRVLAIEALPTSMGGQTDFYLQYGSTRGPINTIPADVWFQFWIYPNYYDDPNDKEDQLSGFTNRNKFIYPCGVPSTETGDYPCKTYRQNWMVLLGSVSGSPSWTSLGEPSSDLFVKAQQLDNVKYSGGKPWNAYKIGQTDLSEQIVANRWTLVKLHFDTSTTSGKWEAWLKPRGKKWIKVAEWIDGVTPNFSWKIPSESVGGHRVFRMPTTVNSGKSGKGNYDSWIYLDDFVMAGSEEALPVYNE
jgi:hypothetical protein